MDNIFATASRMKLRFNVNGTVGVEQLWDLNSDTLINLEEDLKEVVSKFAKTTRRVTRRSAEQTKEELRLAVVSAILDVKLQEEEDEKTAGQVKEHNQEILALIAQKRKQDLANLPVEELEKMLK